MPCRWRNTFLPPSGAGCAVARVFRGASRIIAPCRIGQNGVQIFIVALAGVGCAVRRAFNVT
jgi:hypothetical protein